MARMKEYLFSHLYELSDLQLTNLGYSSEEIREMREIAHDYDPEHNEAVYEDED